jgi:hypothetical protein
MMDRHEGAPGVGGTAGKIWLDRITCSQLWSSRPELCISNCNQSESFVASCGPQDPELCDLNCKQSKSSRLQEQHAGDADEQALYHVIVQHV